jgi:hypothetical protein
MPGALDNYDINGILAQLLRVGPTDDEKRQAGAQALTRTGLGILAANQPSRMPQNPVGILAQGAMGGQDAYQGALDRQGAERKQNAAGALQALQIKKQMEQQQALAGILSPQPATASGTPGMPPTNVAALGNPPGILGPQGAPPQPQAAPGPGGFQPIPLDRLASAAAAGVNVEPFLKLNEQAQGGVQWQDAGNLLIPTRHGQPIPGMQPIPKGSAPASTPGHMSDLSPQAQRDFLLSEKKAGKTDVNVKVDTKVGEGVAKEIGPMLMESRNSALGALDAVATAGRISDAISTGKVNIGPGAKLRTAADQVAQVLGAGGADTAERLVNTRQVGRGLAQFTITARKSLKGQGQVSDFEGKLIQRAESGEIDDFTMPELKAFVDLTERLARRQYEQHGVNIEAMKKEPATRGMVPFYTVPEMPAPKGPAGPPISPETQALLDRFAPLPGAGGN